MSKMVYLECFADEILIRYLGITKKQIDHHKGRTRIVNSLKQSDTCLAVVDEDPQTPTPAYLKECKLIDTTHYIKHLKHTKNKQHIFVLQPRLEDWLIKAAKASKIKLTDFGLPDTYEKLHLVLHNEKVKYEAFLRALDKAQSPALNHFRKLLKNYAR
jgi:uncharacterized protein (DUF1778 family)